MGVGRGSGEWGSGCTSGVWEGRRLVDGHMEKKGWKEVEEEGEKAKGGKGGGGG